MNHRHFSATLRSQRKGNVLLLILGLIIVIGLILAAILSVLLESVFFGIRALDPITFGWVGLVLAAVVLAAAMWPVSRAARSDPMIVLRDE